MTKAVYPVELPANLRNAAERLAEIEGVSVDDWVTFAVAQKVGSTEAVAAFLKHKAAGATGRDPSYYLDRAPMCRPTKATSFPRVGNTTADLRRSNR